MSASFPWIGVATCGPQDLDGPSCLITNQRIKGLIPNLFTESECLDIQADYGITTRQWVLGTKLTEVDLAAEAARKALYKAGIQAHQIDLLILATSTPSRCTSSSASAVAKRLDIRATSFDVRAGGASGLTAWHQAVCAIAGTNQTALVIASETVSPWIDFDTTDISAALFGDGAAALLIRSNQTQLRFQGSTLNLPGRAFTVPAKLPPQAPFDQAAFRFQSAEPAYAKAMHQERLRLAQSLAATLNPITAFFPFAPTQRSAAAQAAAAGVAPANVHTCLAHWGAPGAAAPLIALAEFASEPRPNDTSSTLAFTAVGGGVHSAALTLTT